MFQENRKSGERWRPIVSYEGFYSVSNHGRVRSERSTTRSKKGAIIQPGETRGYKIVALSAPGFERKTWLVHRLVAEAFIGVAPATNAQVNHKNGDRSDNRLRNLEWVSPQENQEHSYEKLGRQRHMRGENNPQGTLTEAQAREIIRLWEVERPAVLRALGRKRLPPEHGLSLEGLGRRYGVHFRAIYRLVSGKTWTHLRTGG